MDRLSDSRTHVRQDRIVLGAALGLAEGGLLEPYAARSPASTSAFFTQSFRVGHVHPNFAAIDVIAAQRDGCSCS